jgi:DNA-binding NtrC family response regulator
VTSAQGLGDTTAPPSSVEGGATARVQQLHQVYAPIDGTKRQGSKERLAVVNLNGDPLVIGREPQGPRVLAVADKRMSRVHTVIARDPTTGDVAVTDRGSRYGTYANGSRVAEQTRLGHGSVIRAGDSVFVLVDVTLTIDDAKRLGPETPAILGKSIAMQRVRGEVALVSRHAAPVLVLGETGAGKERVAQEIHRQSGRRGPLIAVNCAAIAPTLAESEFFGHAAGAFTGAAQKSDGLFAAAHEGTLFLDEIAELPQPLQPKVLRAIATGEVRAVGRTESRRVDVRLVAATHADLEGAVGDGTFRADLFARVAGWTLRVPPLRDRREDVLDLALHFLNRLSPGVELSAGCAECLCLWAWRYNVRELEQTIASAAIRAGDGVLRAEHLPDPMGRPAMARLASSDPNFAPVVSPHAEAFVSPLMAPGREDLERVVQMFEGNVARVAAYFGKDRKQIYRWAERLGLDIDAVREDKTRV